MAPDKCETKITQDLRKQQHYTFAYRSKSYTNCNNNVGSLPSIVIHVAQFASPWSVVVMDVLTHIYTYEHMWYGCINTDAREL